MRKLNYLLFAMLSMVLLSCGSDDIPEQGKDKSIYKIEFEVIGENYSAEAHIYNTDNVNLINDGADTGQSSITTTFKGKKVFSTAKEVKNIVVQGVLTSRIPATLKMVVYKDNNSVYNKSITLNNNQGGNEGTVDLRYTTIGE